MKKHIIGFIVLKEIRGHEKKIQQGSVTLSLLELLVAAKNHTFGFHFVYEHFLPNSPFLDLVQPFLGFQVFRWDELVVPWQIIWNLLLQVETRNAN